MKLVLVSPVHPWRGGIAQHGALLARALADEGHAVRILGYRSLYPRWLYPGSDPRDASASPVSLVGIEVEPLLRPLWPPSWLAAVRAVRLARPEAVLLQWWVPFFAPALASLAALLGGAAGRRIFVCHNVLPHDGGGPVDRALVRLALGRGDAWLVHAKPDEARLRSLLGEGRVAGRVRRAVLPAFDLGASEAGVTRVEDQTTARRRLGLPLDGRVALFFGFVRPYKGLATLIDALPEVRRSVPDLHCLVAGEFWEPAARYAERAKELGVAEALRMDEGYVANEDVADYIAAADVVVLPYLEATQSAVAPMALAAGRPVIASRVGGLPEVVADGRTGLLVRPGDSAALAAALVRFFGEPGLAEGMSEAALSDRARLGWAAVVEAIEDLAEGGAA